MADSRIIRSNPLLVPRLLFGGSGAHGPILQNFNVGGATRTDRDLSAITTGRVILLERYVVFHLGVVRLLLIKSRLLSLGRRGQVYKCISTILGKETINVCGTISTPQQPAPHNHFSWHGRAPSRQSGKRAHAALPRVDDGVPGGEKEAAQKHVIDCTLARWRGKQ